jgi:capsular polysaccharide biosynthesis protein
MELVTIIEFLKKYRIGLLSGVVFGAIFGALSFFILPQKYIAEGSLITSRSLSSENIDAILSDVPAEFQYEGYYARQNAASYTPTLAGILESPDIAAKVLEAEGEPINEKNLRIVNNSIKVKKIAPQVILLQVKTDDKSDSLFRWETIVNEVQLVNSSINSAVSGDPDIYITSISGSPVVRNSFNYILVNIVLGMFFGSLLTLSYYALIENMSVTTPRKRKKK